PGDEKPQGFSYETTDFITDQIPCWLTHTNERTHQVINDNLTLSAMYSGMKRGTGPRYCPSIEDKIVRFNDKPRHQVLLEPEDIQTDIVRSVPGLENAEMMRPGYAIEYDSVKATQLWPTLETKKIAGLYTAGQINGTSGYEEAAAQGIIAGINAALANQNKEPFI